jgi:hypothetical protein
MKTIVVFFLAFVSSIGFSCPNIQGHWSCYEKNLDYNYEETFQVTQQNGIFHYAQTLKDDGGEQPTYEKITDNVVRLVNHLMISDHDYYFSQNSFCPDDQTLQTHEVVERQMQGQTLGKSTAEYIVKLEKNGSLSMITNSIEEDGSVYDNDFVGICQRASVIKLATKSATK